MDTRIPDDVWGLIKGYLFHGKFEAIDLIKYHTELPYMLGMHNAKGVDNTFQYLWDRHSSVFDVLSVGQVREVITNHNSAVRNWYL